MKTFKEIQRFDQWWLRLLLVVILAIAVSPLVLDWDNLKFSKFEIASVILSILVILGLFLGFWYIFKLETTIDEKGITYRFVPFHIKSRFKAWSEIKSAKIRKYNPIREYGGWGYAHLSKHIEPRLRDAGVTDQQIDAMRVANPARWLTF